ncbi:MAG: hypothetical protein Q4A83_01240 [Bacillota bacterium]|nr:hypothetical protein [Bacillota bacterium]
MNLKELSEEYRKSGLACRTRADRLKPLLQSPDLCEMERLRLRRRIYTLETMGREALATAKYLNNYYGDDEYAENQQRRGISGLEELPEAGLGGKLRGGARAMCDPGSTYAATASACSNVLFTANAHADYCL